MSRFSSLWNHCYLKTKDIDYSGVLFAGMKKGVIFVALKKLYSSHWIKDEEIAFFIIHGTVMRTSLPCSADGPAVEQRSDIWMEPW
jgi:hypothetical protein